MRKWKDKFPYSGQTSQIHRLSSVCDPMLCSHHLEILHFWTRGPAISFCTGPHKLCSPDSAVGKEATCNVGGLGSIPRLGRFPGEGEGYPLQHSGLENSMDCRVHGVAKSQTQLSDFHCQMRFCISNMLTGNTDAASPQTTLQVARG